MPINDALMQPGRIVIDVRLPLRPSTAVSPDEPLHALVAAHAEIVAAVAHELELLANGGCTVEEVTPRGRRVEDDIHYQAYADCDDILQGLAMLAAHGIKPSHVQYVTARDNQHYEVDTAAMADVDPSV